MYYFLLLLFGAISGVLGGMGMGGGTLLIPMLTIFLKIPQQTAQAINLISFVPMAAVALIIHAKNDLIKIKKVVPLTVFALFFSIGGSFLLRLTEGGLQTRLFGGFLVILAVLRLIFILKQRGESDQKQAKQKSEPHF